MLDLWDRMGACATCERFAFDDFRIGDEFTYVHNGLNRRGVFLDFVNGGRRYDDDGQIRMVWGRVLEIKLKKRWGLANVERALRALDLRNVQRVRSEVVAARRGAGSRSLELSP